MLRPPTAPSQGLLDHVVSAPRIPSAPLIGVLRGEGIGPEIVDGALDVLHSLEEAGARPVETEIGGAIGREAEALSGAALPDDVAAFCAGVLDRGGAVLNGPGGGRYVYELRRRLGLFVKVSPVQAWNALAEASPLRADAVAGVDLLVVRENLGGVYQGRSEESVNGEGRLVRHDFSYAEEDVRRFLDAAARLAVARRGELTVVTKEAGLPVLSGLWRECAVQSAESRGVACSFVDIDLMAYELVCRPRAFDVVAAPNMFGDMLGDLAAVVLGARSLSFGGSFTPAGGAVYQTNHGAAHDIAGLDRANPAGQILSLAMLLRESLGFEREAQAIEEGIRRVWAEGHRTADLGASDAAVGTRELSALVGAAAADLFAAGAE